MPKLPNSIDSKPNYINISHFLTLKKEIHKIAQIYINIFKLIETYTSRRSGLDASGIRLNMY